MLLVWYVRSYDATYLQITITEKPHREGTNVGFEVTIRSQLIFVTSFHARTRETTGKDRSIVLARRTLPLSPLTYRANAGSLIFTGICFGFASSVLGIYSFKTPC